MHYGFSKNKEFIRNNIIFALFSNCLYAFIISAACYALSNLIVFINDDIDTISLLYLSVFSALFIILNIIFDLVYFNIEKGLILTDTEIIITNGYFARFQDFRTKIKFSNIESIKYDENLDLRELKRDYKNSNYSRITIGVSLKMVPVARITTNEEHPKIYFVACENITGLIEAFNSLSKKVVE